MLFASTMEWKNVVCRCSCTSNYDMMMKQSWSQLLESHMLEVLCQAGFEDTQGWVRKHCVKGTGYVVLSACATYCISC